MIKCLKIVKLVFRKTKTTSFWGEFEVHNEKHYDADIC